MRRRFLSLFFLAACLVGCASTTAIPKVEEGQIGKLKSDNNGIALMHVSVSGSTPAMILVTLAHPNVRGHYEAVRSWLLKLPQDSAQLPGQLTLPAGHYGIVELKVLDETNYAARRGRRREYHAQNLKLEGLLLTKVYERPMATFTVEAGEVVDIGSIQVLDGPIQQGLIEKKGLFAVKVTPIPEVTLKNLAERSPALAKARLVRTMTATHQTQ